MTHTMIIENLAEIQKIVNATLKQLADTPVTEPEQMELPLEFDASEYTIDDIMDMGIKLNDLNKPALKVIVKQFDLGRLGNITDDMFGVVGDALKKALNA